VAEAIVNVYTTRTSGSFMQKKGASIVWNHQHADPEFGAMQARELQYHLQGVLTAFPVAVRVGKGYVEACPNGINKGSMAERAVDIAMGGGGGANSPGVAAPLDYVLCIGDDSSDELMFQALHSKFGMHPADLSLFTVTVGRKPSKAQAYLGDHTEVVELLKMLSSIGNAKSKRIFSMGDLVKLDAAESPQPSPSGDRISRHLQSGAGASSASIGVLPQRPQKRSTSWTHDQEQPRGAAR
jgi:trehalose 6-phosphate synthase/phosphatase